MDGLDDITDDQTCPSCFELDATAVDHDRPGTFVDQRSLVVAVTTSFDEVQETAESGCQQCAILLKVMRFFGFVLERHKDVCRITLRLPIGQGNPEISFIVRGSKVHAQLYTSPEGKPWKRIRSLPDICINQLSPDSLWFMKACLETCRTTHTLCQRADGKLPTRLLDLGTPDDSLVRLIDTQDATSTDYIALSYCWGETIGIRTTSDIIGKIRFGVPISDLPQAYIDAVAISRELEVRYLWIDALCIIQDCFEDWERESTIMGGIYSKALLTIAATSSPSAALSFLHRESENDQSSHSHHPKEVFSEWVDDGGSPALIKARLISTTGVHWVWQENTQSRSTPEPLSLRGWTLQERLLSNRLLSVSETEMQWVCQEAVTCECRSNLNYRRDFGLLPLRQITLPQDAYTFWHKVVESYTGRKLTEPKDKLPAISAVAAAAQSKIGSDYAAGLWVKNVHLDLLWRRCAPIIRPLQSEYIAPTFSWASVDGEIDYYCFRNGKRPYKPTASVVSIETFPSSNAPLGRVRGGSLTIKGPLLPAYVEKSFSDGWMVVRLDNWKLEAYSDTALQELVATAEDGTLQKSVSRWSPLNEGPELWEIKRSSSESGGQPQPTPTVSHADYPTRCWVLQLGTFTAPQCDELLILGQSQTKPGAYERIGLASRERIPGGELFTTESLKTITIV